MTPPLEKTLVVTCCSRDKDPAPGKMPAIDRYSSSRIRASGETADSLEWEFRILSGLYGLLEPDRPIPVYDHLLTTDEVPAHTDVVAGQLKGTEASRVVFITRTDDDDPGCRPYREVMRLACRSVGVDFVVREIPAGEVAASDLTGTI